MQRLCGGDFLHRWPLQGDVAGEFGLDQQGLAVRFGNGSCQSVAIFQYYLIGKERCAQRNYRKSGPKLTHGISPSRLAFECGPIAEQQEAEIKLTQLEDSCHQVDA